MRAMQIKSTLTNRSGQVLDVVYSDMLSERDLGDRKVKAVSAYCFYGDKLVLVYSDKKQSWTPPGGKVEEGEGLRAAVVREIKEETNMKVLKHRFIGYQDISEPNGILSQTRSVCLVEPDGDFVSDPDGDVTKIELIDPRDYKSYFDWGKIGDHLLARALELKAQMDLEVGYTE